MGFDKYLEKLVQMWEHFLADPIINVVQFVTFAMMFYLAFKLLKDNRGGKIIALMVAAEVLFGFSFSWSDTIDSQTILIILFMMVMLVFYMFSTEIKRLLLDSRRKKHGKDDGLTVSKIEDIIDETIHAVQHMSKNDIGALIVLSNQNLPEEIIASGTVIDADINANMIEAVFFPKAPLHDGAMIIEGNKIHAAGCFLPLIQNDALPQEIGSRHRAALGVTKVANVTAIVVSEETGIISIVKNGEIKKRYASDSDLKNALSAYYWTDLTAED